MLHRSEIFIASGLILSGVSQQILLPLWISTFQNGMSGGEYFILFFSGSIFAFGFWLSCIPLKNRIETSMFSKIWQPYLIGIGLCDALNGIAIVYNSNINRVSGPLQTILLQSNVISVVILSKLFLKKNPTKNELLGVIIVILGMITAMIPIWINIHNDQKQFSASEWYYPIFYVTGCFPCAVMNILMEKFQKTYHNDTKKEYPTLLLQSIVNTYQLIFL